MSTLRVAVLDDYQHVARRFGDWDTLDAEVVVFHEPMRNEAQVLAVLAGFDVIVAMRERTRFPAEVLRGLGRLKLLVTTGPANAAIDVTAAAAQGVVVSGTGYPELGSTSELTWGLILASLRHIPEEAGQVRVGRWQTTVGTGLERRTLGLLGLGRLGSRVARVGRAFGMEVIAWSPNLTPEAAAEHDAVAVPKGELFARSDVVSVHLMLSDRSRGLVGADELKAMKPTALLVNTSRGPIVDEDALVEALVERRIAGAALDVFATEPLPPQHIFRRLGNVLVTPHLGYVTEGHYSVFYRDAVEDIAAFVAGAPIRVVEPVPST